MAPASTIDVAETRRAAEAIRWFHTMDLGGGIVTRGVYDPARRVGDLHLPASLAGRTVLDVGAWDGYFAFEMERRGASRVLATDSFSWGGQGWGTKEGFELARQALGSRVEDLEIDPTALTAEAIGRFDVVLFLGVLYHLPDPLQVLERVFDVTGDLLVLETEVDMLFTRRPAVAFYEGTDLNTDPTNWWGPNVPAVLGLLRAAGFRETTVVHRHPLHYRAVRAAHRRLRAGERFLHALQRGRVVVHARR